MVTAQPGGHGATLALNGAILLRTTGLDGIDIDATARVARVEAGVKWGELVAAFEPTGLGALAGSNPDVTVVGYSLGTGLSWFGRAHGYGPNAIRAFEVVLADGRRARVDADHEPELFWALRGGGGDFAIVLAVEIELFAVPHLHGGRMMWPVELAPEVLRTYAEVTSTAPDELSLWAWIMHFPPLPELPQEVAGKSFVMVDGSFLGGRVQADLLLAPFRSLHPLVETFSTVPLSRIGDIAAEPVDPMPGLEWARLLSDLGPETIDAIVSATRPGTHITAVEIRHLGGALARRAPGSGAVPAVSEPYLVFGLWIPVNEAAALQVLADLQGLETALGEHVTPRTFFNFLGHGSLDRVFDAPTRTRLQAVKRAYDPAGTIRSNRPVLAG